MIIQWISDNKQVRINISNLAETVISSDLQELFGAFNLHKVSVNFNENGGAAGTGDITLKKYDADRLIQKFAGVALDGKVMIFFNSETILHNYSFAFNLCLLNSHKQE